MTAKQNLFIYRSIFTSEKDRLNKEFFIHLADEYMDKIGFGDQPYLVYQNEDAGHPHVHVLSTLIKDDGKRIFTHFIALKLKYPDAILLFRVGDFYEVFGSDAVIVANVLGTILTKSVHQDTPFPERTGFAFHSLDLNLSKLVRSGYKVAVCDELEAPPLKKKLRPYNKR